ncbi:hypothetical protein FA15DRAFT_595551, partial [Coprinopsis marcescibilis]
SKSDIDLWIATTDANVTIIGDPINALDTRVVYCNRRTQNVCGGDCTVYNGNAKCLWAHTTQCIWASTNVGFCDRDNCGGSCNQFNSCGSRLDGNFCYTPGTASILVPFT